MSAASTRWSELNLARPAPKETDPEGPRLPSQLPPVIDAHVHLFPDRVFDAVWRWFDKHAWEIRYKLYSEQVIAFLLSRGVEKLFALHYAHKPGMARALNGYIADLCARNPRVIGFATAYPGEPDAYPLLMDAFAAGLKGVKLHCHVQAFAPDDPRAEPIYRACSEASVPLVMHAGREPAMPDYPVDPYTLCDEARVEAVLKAFPKLRLCIPHLGVNEEQDYGRLIQRYDNLWLDTTMAVADYFPVRGVDALLRIRPERILYGTDFPNIPYAWDRELRRLIDLRLPEAALAGILGANTETLLSGRH